MIKRINSSDKGAALPMVILMMLLIMSFSGVVITVVTTQTKTEVSYESDISALHAAEAGLHKYLWYLNKETGATISLDTDTSYPDYNSIAAYRLTKIETESTSNKVVIVSTGWTLQDPSIKRSIKATFVKKSFSQFVYFSHNDHEIYWTDNERCYGPYHTNSILYIDGDPIFFKRATYAGGIEIKSGSNPAFHEGRAKVPVQDLPTSNQKLKTYAQQSEGYYYKGRTSIMLNESGDITIWNPNNTPEKETRPLPANGVIYVDDLPGAYDSRYNKYSGNVFISGKLKGRLTVAAKRDIYITDYDPTYYSFSDAKNKGQTNGILYANTTFAIDEMTGVVAVDPNSQDMLGLIADRNVVILTRGWFNSSTAESAKDNINIYAAIMAINGKFINSYHLDNGNDDGSYPRPKGTLSVRGSITNKERGAVGLVGGDGYSKDYAHDERMTYDSPPYYLEPENSGWEITEWTEIN